MDKEKLKEMIKELIDEIDEPRSEDEIFCLITKFINPDKMYVEFGDIIITRNYKF